LEYFPFELIFALLHEFVVPEDDFFEVVVDLIEVLKSIESNSFETEDEIIHTLFLLSGTTFIEAGVFWRQTLSYRLIEPLFDIIGQLVDLLHSDCFQQPYFLFAVELRIHHLVDHRLELAFAQHRLALLPAQFIENDANVFTIQSIVFDGIGILCHFSLDGFLKLRLNKGVDIYGVEDGIDTFLGRNACFFWAFPLLDHAQGYSWLVRFQRHRPADLKKCFAKLLNFGLIHLPSWDLLVCLRIIINDDLYDLLERVFLDGFSLWVAVGEQENIQFVEGAAGRIDLFLDVLVDQFV
jgi:hypothetical protein